MVIDFSKLDLHDRPTLILKNAGDTPLAVIGHATNIEIELNYNEISVLTFNVPSSVDGEEVPYYNDVIGMRIVELENIGQFTLISPEQHDDGVKKYKKCKAYSLEYEFSYKKITMAKDTYKFYGDVFSNQSNTVLGMIMDLMPSWNISSVSVSLLNKYRTFEVNNENLYNFIKNTVQQSFGCIFDFNTKNRSITIRDVTLDAGEQPVYLSTQNLVKEIVIHEDVENMVTRLDVNGADGVDIRDVNPTGTNKIINLDYYMNTKNFSQSLIDKYNSWKQLVNFEREAYYANSITYSLAVMKLSSTRAKLKDLEGELLTIDNQRGVIIQAISKGLSSQSDLDSLNVQFNNKAYEIENMESEIEDLEDDQEYALALLQNIVHNCSFERYFTSQELAQLDRYIRDGEVTESSFVSTNSVFTDNGIGANLNGVSFNISNSEIKVINQNGNRIYDIRGGKVIIGSSIEASIISAVINYSYNSGVLFTASLGNGVINEDQIDSGSITISAPSSSINSYDTSSLSINSMRGYMYFSLNPSEYQRRSVAWDLYEYGEALAEKLSQPTYTFSVESANFLTVDDFETFKNHLRLGDKIYLDNGEQTLTPICIGLECSYDDLSKLSLKFGDSYVRSDTSFKLVDILDKSVSMGRTVDAGKFNYEEYTDTGVRTSVRQFMTEAIDVAKNKILSSKDQAITWDTAGLRLRKWANESQTAYENEQIWMNNNSVLMTDDNWQTAKMAIGKILKPGANPQSGEYLWGLIAEMVVGRMIAGESLVIESAKKNGSGVSVFTVDESGCRIENGDLSLIGEQTTQVRYLVRSDTNMYSAADTSSTVVKAISAGTVVYVMNDSTGSGSSTYSNGMYYCLAPDGARGWISSSSLLRLSSSVGKKHIVIHPDVGVVIGKYPVVNVDNSGHYTINSDNAKMWIDGFGNVYLSGAINATSLQIKGTNADNIGGDMSAMNQRITNVELKTTDNAIISTVTESEGGQAAIGSLIEQNASSIRMLAEQITWESSYSEMAEDGTLTVKRAIIDGAMSGVKSTRVNEADVLNGLVLGNNEIAGIKNSNTVFNVLLPGVGNVGYVDDKGVAHTISPAVPEYEPFNVGDRIAPSIAGSTNSDIQIAAVGSTINLRLSAGGKTQIVLEPGGTLWLCPKELRLWPYSGKLYIGSSPGVTGTIHVGSNYVSFTDGIMTDLQTDYGAYNGNIPFVTDLIHLGGDSYDWDYKTLHVTNGIITSVSDGYVS